MRKEIPFSGRILHTEGNEKMRASTLKWGLLLFVQIDALLVRLNKSLVDTTKFQIQEWAIFSQGPGNQGIVRPA